MAANLPPYDASQANVFGDTIAPELFGIPGDGRPAVEDPRLIPRTEQADAVLRARIATITRDQLDDQTSFIFVLRPVGPPILGTSPSSDSIELRLQPGHPSLQYVQHRQSALTGKTVLLFLRRYNDGGDVVLHFHVQPDDPSVIEAIERVKVLDELES